MAPAPSRRSPAGSWSYLASSNLAGSACACGPASLPGGVTSAVFVISSPHVDAGDRRGLVGDNFAVDDPPLDDDSGVGTHRRLTEPIELRQALLCELHKAHDFRSHRSPFR